MSDAIETVKIVKDNATGYAIINKSSFDPEKHELFEEITEPRREISTEKAPLVQEALALMVADKKGKPFPESILERWSVERLKEAITKAKK